MNRDMPIARLRPGGRSDHMPAITRMVAPTGAPGLEGSSAPLREWHAMTPSQRKGAWAELVEWVVWLHDRYELAVEHRVPACWAEHPGLIEELCALKAWREQIYHAAQPSGQAARYWHAELRQVLQAAATFYAKGCRAGHKTPAALAVADEALQRRWLAADPLVGIPPQLLTACDPVAGETVVMSDPQMRAAIDAGLARPLGAQIGDFQHYQDAWWMPVDGQPLWQKIIDPILAADLDNTAKRMAIADAIVEDRRRIHDALS